MKTLITYMFCALNWISVAQNELKIENLGKNNWTIDTTRHKVILITAEWCSICKKARAILNESEKIKNSSDDSFRFFEISESTLEDIIYHDKTFSFVSYGPKIGRHNFIDFIMDSEDISYPSYIFLDKKDNVIERYSGLITESDWLFILGNTSRQSDSPDSFNKH